MVGPDGTVYQRRDTPPQGQAPDGKTPPRPGTAELPDTTTGAENGLPGASQGRASPDGKGGQVQAQQKAAPADTPRPEQVNKLFGPDRSRPPERATPEGTARGRSAGPRGGGPSGQTQHGDETDGTGDPVEAAAARRLRQAIQRIQTGRDGRLPSAGHGEVSGTDRRRDW
jgi:hypothetical protein